MNRFEDNGPAFARKLPSSHCFAETSRRAKGSRVEGSLQRTAQPLFHFGGGGFSEGDNKDFVERCIFIAEAIQTTLDERVCFARTRAGYDEHVAARGDGLPLRQRQAVIGFRTERFHAVRTG